jgi:hypothetical protein
MKQLLLLCLFLVLTCCDRQVDPESITEMVYRYTSGFAGITWELSLRNNQEVYQQVGRGKNCEDQLTDAQWNALVQGFDWQEFKAMKSEEIPVCCDIGKMTLKVKTRWRSHEVTWENFPPEGSVRNLQKKLNERMQGYYLTCK